MNVIAWNLGHQIWPRPIPDHMVDVLLALEADTVLFNEYVDDDSREPFKAAMRTVGFDYQAISPAPPRHHRIFAASRMAFEVGDLEPPQFDSWARSNFLHLRFADFPVELVGIRAPAYKLKSDLRAYWTQLATIMDSVKKRPILFAGDINRDPFNEAEQPGVAAIPFAPCGEYTVPNPAGDWSFMANTDKGYRIDHVLHSASVGIESAEYVARLDGRVLAGPRAEEAISDHAALRFTVADSAA